MGVVEPVQQRQCQKPWEIVDQPDTGNEGQFSEMARNPHGTPRNPHGTPFKTATEPPAEPPEPTCLEGSTSAPCVPPTRHPDRTYARHSRFARSETLRGARQLGCAQTFRPTLEGAGRV